MTWFEPKLENKKGRLRRFSNKTLLWMIVTLACVAPILASPFTQAANAQSFNTVKLTKIVAGYRQSFALDTEGRLWAWGAYEPDFAFGPIRNPYVKNFFETKPIKDIYAGSNSLVVLLEDGTVWIHSNAQHNGALFAKQLQGLKDIDSVRIVLENTYYLQKDGTVWSMRNGTPIRRPDLSNLGFKQFCNDYAIKEDGTVWKIGASSTGPTQLTQLSNVKNIVSGYYKNVYYALMNDGSVWGWGSVWGGTPDHSDQKVDEASPVRIEGLDHIKEITSGEFHFAALKEDGSIWTWGANNVNQLGNGTTTIESFQPAQVKNLPQADHVVSGNGANHTFAILADGTAMAWGKNEEFETGTTIDGETKSVPVPAKVYFAPQAVDADKHFNFQYTGEFVQGSITPGLNQLLKTNDKYLGIGKDNEFGVFTSKDGVKWKQTLTEPYQLRSAAWSGSRYVVVSFRYAWSSPDGVSWKKTDFKQDMQLQKVIWSGSRFFALANVFNTNTGNFVKTLIYTSTDGAVWTKALESPGWLKDIAAHKDTVVAVGTMNKQAAVLQSSNLKNWKTQTFTLGKENQQWKAAFTDIPSFLNVQWVNGAFIIMSDHIYRSQDGINWSDINGDFSEFINVNPAGRANGEVIWTGKDYRYHNGVYLGVSADLRSWKFYEKEEFWNVNQLIWIGDRLLGIGGDLIMKISDK
jgi:alpha-tubulin suppressor-like RCC1 family protein